MEQTKYTVFVERDHDGGGFDCYYSGGGFVPAELQGLIEWVPVGLYTPVAWCVGHADLNAFDHALAESIAAGRVIELVDGKYVPRGVPAPSPPPTLDKMEAEKRFADALARDAADDLDLIRPPLDWNKSTPFDPFPGFTVRYDTGPMVEERAHPLSRISSMSHMLGNGIKG